MIRRRVYAEPWNNTTISITRMFGKRSQYVGRIVAVNKDDEETIIENAATFYDESATYVIPYEYTDINLGNLPSVVTLQLKKNNGDWTDLLEFDLVADPSIQDWNGDGKPDNVSTGGGPPSTTVAVSGGNITVDNHPSVYPIPQTQLDSLKPDADLLTTTKFRELPINAKIVQAIRQTTVPSTPASLAVYGPITNHTVIYVPPTHCLRLVRNAGHVDPTAGEVYPLVTLKIGSKIIYQDKLEAGLPWSETVCFEGDFGENLTITVDTTTTIYLNMRYELFN